MTGFLPTIFGRISVGLISLALACATERGLASEKLTPAQARSVALLVAGHDKIDVQEDGMVVDSMDGNGAFVPGYFSFIFILVDQHHAGKDRTLGMYAVSPETGDVWELNLCKHYDFPELARLQRAIRKKTGAAVMDESASARRMGCEKHAASVHD